MFKPSYEMEDRDRSDLPLKSLKNPFSTDGDRDTIAEEDRLE